MNLGETPFMLATYRKRAEARTIEPEHTIILILLDALKEAQAVGIRQIERDQQEIDALRAQLEEARAELAKRPTILLGGQHAVIQSEPLAQNMQATQGNKK